MSGYLRHRYALAVPFVVLALVTVIGGLLNVLDARGRIVDDFTSDGVPARLSFGPRATAAASDGSFEFDAIPRTSKFRIDAPGYLRTGAPPDQTEIRLQPLSVTIQVYEEGTEPKVPVKQPQIRQGDNLLGTGNDSGNLVISPHPGRDATVLVCAAGYAAKTIQIHGVAMSVTVAKGEPACPPLPTPSPPPGVSPSPSSPASAAPSPTPSPTGSP